MNEKSGPILRVCNERPTNSRSERSEFECGLSATGRGPDAQSCCPYSLHRNDWLAFLRPDVNDDPHYTPCSRAWRNSFCIPPGLAPFASSVGEPGPCRKPP